MNKIKKWFNSNNGNLAIIILFLSSLILCANLFSRISDPIVTIIGCIFMIIGIGIIIYNIERDRND